MTGHNPRKHRVRPGEVLMVSAVLAVFVGLVVLMGTREWKLSLIFAGVAFIVGVVVFSVLSLASAPREINGPVLGEPFPRGHDDKAVDVTTEDASEPVETVHETQETADRRSAEDD